MGKLGQSIKKGGQSMATLGHHAGRHWGYFKQTLGHGSSAVNLAQGLTTGIGYATGKDTSGTTAMLNSAGAIIDDTQQGMQQAENVGKQLQKKDASSLAMSGLTALGNYRTGRQ